jgi:hypothetical protein
MVIDAGGGCIADLLLLAATFLSAYGTPLHPMARAIAAVVIEPFGRPSFFPPRWLEPVNTLYKPMCITKVPLSLTSLSPSFLSTIDPLSGFN